MPKPTLKRRVKNFSKLGLRKMFELGQRFGFDVLPRHFYSEIPVIHEMRKNTEWKAPYSMIGVPGTDLQEQLEFVKTCCPPAMVEALRSKQVHEWAVQKNGEDGYGAIEADYLYALVATTRPRQILQIGCGVSTAVCLKAAEDAGYRPEIICVEPYPTEFLIRDEQAGNLRLIKQKAQALDLKVIEDLGSDLLFFIDSTHTLGPAGEVSRIMLEMLPRLKRGARIHFHDILFPYDYDRHILDTSLFFWHESVLLHAFLCYNSRFRIRVSLSMLHYAMPEVLRQYLPNYQPAGNDQGLSTSPGHSPCSTYVEVVA